MIIEIIQKYISLKPTERQKYEASKAGINRTGTTINKLINKQLQAVQGQGRRQGHNPGNHHL